MATVPATTAEIHYPDSDGQPVGETPFHIRNLFYITAPLERRFADRPQTCVAANMFVYYEEGNPRKHVSPDVFVVHEVAAKDGYQRRKYLVWEEGKGLDLVIEVTSESTKDEDFGAKLRVYRDILGVREYFIFDPHDEYLHPRLQGFRLENAAYVPITPVANRLPSEVLGLHLEADGFLLRFYDPVQGTLLPIPSEVYDSLHDATEARRRAEAEAERLRREVEELRRRLP